jgi:HEAT repeat protein
MRHLPHFRYIFAGLSVGLIAGLTSFSSAQDQRMRREAYKSEYRISAAPEDRPAVKRLKEALSLPIRGEPPDEKDLNARKTNLASHIKDLDGVLEFRQALMLHEWRDNDFDKQIAELDREMREKLADNLIQTLRKALKSGDTTRELAAADLLSEVGISIRGISGPSKEEQRSLAAALAPDLADLLGRKKAAVNAAAARALGKIYADPTIAVPALERALQSGQVGEQRAAAEGLTSLIQVTDKLSKEAERAISRGEAGEIGARVVLAVSRGLQNPDSDVRRQCAEALRQTAATLGENVPFLRPLEEEPKEAVGPQKDQGALLPLAKALGDRGESLARLLRDQDAEVRLAAARALEEMGNARSRFQRVTGSMAEGSGEKKEGNESLPQEALFRGLHAAIPALSEGLSDPDPEVRLASVEVFESLGNDAAPAATALTRTLGDSNRFVRWAAARALSNIDPEADPKAAETAVPALARVLFDPDLNTRMAAAATLEKYGRVAKRAVPEMARAVATGDPDSRVAVIRAVEAVDPADAQPAIPVLSRSLTHPDNRVRRVAAEALGRIGPAARQAEPALRRALDDSDDLVRKAAAEALMNISLKE